MKFKYLLLAVMLFVNSCADKKSTKYEFNVGTSQGDNSLIYLGLVEMKKNVEARTDGNLIVNVFPSSQLGSEEDIIEQAKVGANVGTITDSGRLSQYVKELGIVGVAYIADSYEEVKKIVESPVYAGWLEELKEHNLAVLSMNWFQGSRHMFTLKPINSPADLQGVLMRTPAPPVWAESIKSLGATPVGMPWTEVYPALQQKVIDAFEVQTSAAYSANLQEITKYMTKTSHFQLMSGIVMGNKYLESLPEEYRKILIEEAIKAGDYESELEIAKTEEYEKEFVEKYNVKISDVDLAPFKERAKSVISVLDFQKEYALLQDI